MFVALLVEFAHFHRMVYLRRINFVYTLRPRQYRSQFADDIFTCNFFNENYCFLIKFSLKYVRKGQIDNNPALVQIMAWRRSGDKPLSEPMMISLPTHICVTRPQWVLKNGICYIPQTAAQYVMASWSLLPISCWPRAHLTEKCRIGNGNCFVLGDFNFRNIDWPSITGKSQLDRNFFNYLS